jgi:hypothetical protein
VHGADHGQPIAGVGHLQVAQQYIEMLVSDEFQGVVYIRSRHHFKAVMFKDQSQGSQKGVVVVYQKNPGFSRN